MVFVGMLIEGQQDIRLITGAENLSRTDSDLKNGWAACNRRGNRHEGHDFLLAAARQSRQKPADGLDAVLRIARYTDNGFGYFGNFGCAPGRLGGRCCVTHEVNRFNINYAKARRTEDSSVRMHRCFYTLSLTDLMSNSNQVSQVTHR